MKILDLIEAIKAAGKRYALVGDMDNGAIIALDIEGRVYSYMDGEVLNKVNMDAVTGISTKAGYINPAGDGLWPAPEGSALGFEYSTGDWRVPPSLTSAKYLPTVLSPNRSVFQAEVDFINNCGIGLPFLLSRDITVKREAKTLEVTIIEGLEYIGALEYPKSLAIAAPWSLCQFDCNADCKLTIQMPSADSIWDLYPWDSTCHRHVKGDTCEVDLVTDFRFQLGMSPAVNWIEFTDNKRGFSVKRTAEPIDSSCTYIDIADRDPAQPYSDAKPIRFSAYCDPSGFMEIEAAGGTPEKLVKGAKSTVKVTNVFTKFDK